MLNDVWQHDLDPTDTSTLIPTPVRCSYERLQDNGVYLIGKLSLMRGFMNSSVVGIVLFSSARLYRKQWEWGYVYVRKWNFHLLCLQKVIFNELDLVWEKLQIESDIIFVLMCANNNKHCRLLLIDIGQLELFNGLIVNFWSAALYL